jgi:hypothetical protein
MIISSMLRPVADGVQFETQTGRFFGVRLLLLIGLLLVPAATAQAQEFELDVPDPCITGICVITATYDPGPITAPVLLEADWGDGRSSLTCEKAPCRLRSPILEEPGPREVVLSVAGVIVTTLDVSAVGEFTTAVEGEEEYAYASYYCHDMRDGETCGPGLGRRTPGGNGKVSHKGWPAVTGILWMVTAEDRSARTLTGGALNDELLGHHGSDRIAGGAGRDILWGDWDPKNNNTTQRDVLLGGAGNDFLYPSHGRSIVKGGPGNDYVWAYYGGGVIDCGPGNDRARVRWIGNKFKVRNCETIGHFCAFGARPGGGCYKPGEKPRKR